jgi:hypothetical protein
MDTNGHGLRTGYVDERLQPIGEPFIVFPFVFIRVHPWFLQVQVPDLGLAAIPTARSLLRNHGRAPRWSGWRRWRLLAILKYLMLPVDVLIECAVLGLLTLHKFPRGQSGW